MFIPSHKKDRERILGVAFSMKGGVQYAERR